MSSLKDFFDDDGQSGGSRGTKPGGNLRIRLMLTSEEITNGVEKKIKIKRQIACKTCDGSGARDKSSLQTCKTCNGLGHVIKIAYTILGQLQANGTCPKCRGTRSTVLSKCKVCRGDGMVSGEEIININIPAGVSAGTEFNITGKGNAGFRGHLSGDLIVLIEEISPEEQQMSANLKSHPDKNGKSYFEQLMDYIGLRKSKK